MGKPSESPEYIEKELLRKIKILFDEVTRKDERDPNVVDEPVTFATFVESFDTNDKLTKKFFEFLLREVRRRRNGSQRQRPINQPRGMAGPPWQSIQRALRHRRQNTQMVMENLDFGSEQSVEMSFRGASGTPVFSLRSGPSWGARAAASGEGEAAVEAGEASASASSADTLESAVAVGALLARAGTASTGLVDPPRSHLEALNILRLRAAVNEAQALAAGVASEALGFPGRAPRPPEPADLDDIDESAGASANASSDVASSSAA